MFLSCPSNSKKNGILFLNISTLSLRKETKIDNDIALAKSLNAKKTEINIKSKDYKTKGIIKKKKNLTNIYEESIKT